MELTKNNEQRHLAIQERFFKYLEQDAEFPELPVIDLTTIEMPTTNSMVTHRSKVSVDKVDELNDSTVSVPPFRIMETYNSDANTDDENNGVDIDETNSFLESDDPDDDARSAIGQDEENTNFDPDVVPNQPKDVIRRGSKRLYLDEDEEDEESLDMLGEMPSRPPRKKQNPSTFHLNSHTNSEPSATSQVTASSSSSNTGRITRGSAQKNSNPNTFLKFPNDTDDSGDDTTDYFTSKPTKKNRRK